MSAIEALNISKSFGSVKAVDEVTFSVEYGEVFGLLGPNGAGKTTTIRMVLDIFKPDTGRVAILDGPMNEAKKDRIGYMPEERGLYQDIPLERVLVYMASLKGTPAQEARRRVRDYLERFELSDYRRKKVKDLSKGMQQKAQIIATLVHQPELVIIDEPFSGLDPINTQMVKDLLLDLNRQGATIIMSTHQMHQMEEMCSRILLFNRGRNVLYGELESLRRQFSGNAVLVRAQGELPDLPGVLACTAHNNALRLALSPEIDPQQILQQLVSRGVVLEKFEIALPTLEEIFVRVVQTGQGGFHPGRTSSGQISSAADFIR
ncbi:MAG: ATP-binding cassette domain-containing protein [Chloroflexota bacterium]